VLGAKFDLFRARVCIGGHTGFDLNIIKVIGSNINKVVEFMDKTLPDAVRLWL
jgi:hypothetical protein